MISLEQAIHKLTFHVASVYGMEGRGLLRPGYFADVTIFDPKTVNPAGTKRLTQRSEGICLAIVNGKVVYEDDNISGDMKGKVSRGTGYQGGQ